MSWDSILFQFVMALIAGFVIVFVLLNILMGCESWNDPACVTPSEMVEIFQDLY